MALDDLLDEEGEGEGEEEVVEPVVEVAAPAPEYVSLAQFKQMESIITNLNTTMQGLASGFNVMASQRQTPAAPAGPAPITDEELEAEGLNPKVIRRLLAGNQSSEVEALKRELQELREVGLGSVGELVHTAALGSKPYYAKYKAEIDAMVASLPDPRAKLNAKTLEACYKLVVAEHLDEILVDDRTARARKAALGVQTSTGSTGGRKQASRGRSDDSLSADNHAALETLGMDPDEFARSMGYKNYAAYEKDTEIEGEE